MSEAGFSKVTAVDYDPFAATSVARVVPTTEDRSGKIWRPGGESRYPHRPHIVLFESLTD